jgi:hypothetical protein
MLVLLGALTWAYHGYALAGLEEPIVDWGLAFLAAVFAAGSVGSIIDAIQKRGVAAALRRADRGEPPRDGGFAAAVGELHPIGQPLLSPLRGIPCVAYEYKMRGKDAGLAAYSGHALTPSVIRGAKGDVRLCGYPDLDELPFDEVEGEEARERAARYVAQTRFEVAKARGVFSALRELYTDDDGSLNLDWKTSDAPSDPSGLELEEKVVAVGRPVRVLGLWSQRSGGLVNAWDKNVLLKLYTKDSKPISTSSLPRRLITPVILLAVVHGALWFPYQNRRRTEIAASAKKLCEAVRRSELEATRQLLTPELANASCPDGLTPLIHASTAPITALLLEAGADPAAETADGETALHRAIQRYEIAPVRLLLEAGADPDLASRKNGMTPLWLLGNGHPELRELLLEAGAVDDRVTAENGTPLPPGGGAVVDVCRRYGEALLAGHVGAARALATDDHQGYWGGEISPAQQQDLPTAIESFGGYTTGEEPGSLATVTVTGPRSDGRLSSRTFQLVRWDTSWRVHRLAVDYAPEAVSDR